jgi:hypothetical protein
MKRLLATLRALALLPLIFSLPLVQAETRVVGTRTVAPYYDLSKEVTLNGTVSSVLTKPSKGMAAGSHLLLKTSSGPVDASLGRFGLQGHGALSVEAGRQVEVTGVMKTLNGRQVFVTRTVKVGDEVYTMRNQHGNPVSPQTRARANSKTGQKGVWL